MAGHLLSDGSSGIILMRRSNFFERCIDFFKTLMTSRSTEDVTEENTKLTTVKDLPEDVTVNILMRLPVKSLCCVQCVSKTCFEIARSPEFATMHSLRHLHDDDDSAAMNSLMLATTWPYRYYYYPTPEWWSWQSFKYNSSDKALVGSRHVPLNFLNHDFFSVACVFWNLFLVDSLADDPCLLINPLRDEVLELPSSNIQVPTTDDEIGDADWYGMGFDSITSTYKIVHLSASEKRNCVVAQVLVLGTSSWKQIRLAPPFDESRLFSGQRDKSAIYVAGDMHWMIYCTRESPGHIISFNFNREEFYATLPPADLVFHDNVTLLKFRGRLALVEVEPHEDNIKIWVLKSSGDEKKWELHHNVTIEDLGRCFTIRNFFHWTCAEWEHGICFASDDECNFVDLRHLRMVRVRTPPPKSFSIFSLEHWTSTRESSSIFSYTESLISLKNYGKLYDCRTSKTRLDLSTQFVKNLIGELFFYLFFVSFFCFLLVTGAWVSIKENNWGTIYM